MPASINEKKIAVDKLHEIANKASSALVANYHGTSVSELTKLRENARDSSVHIKVIRNTLAKRALKDTKFSCFDELLVGPSILVFSIDDPTDAAKLINNFNKVNPNFEVKGLSMGDSLLDLARFKEIANMPNRNDAITKLSRVLKAPLVKIASLTNELPSKLVRTLGEVKQLKLQAET